MSGVKIITDSAGDFAPEFMQEKGITVVPLAVHFGTETFRDWYDIRGKQFYDRLRAGGVLPRTSQPSPAAFQKAFAEATADGSSVVCITLSSGVSGTYQSAVIARDMLPGKPITVIDSKQAACGEGLLALTAQEMAAAGATAEEIASRIVDALQKMVSVFSVDTLEYLAKNGRIGRAARFLGTLLNMKPILGLDKDGYVTAIERVRGSGKVIPALVEQALARAGSNKAAVLAVAHADCPDAARELKEAATSAFKVKRVFESELGPVIGSHVGPGTMALFVLPE
ncbi:MAG: DegV family protein [Bacillota bacterium]